MARHAEGWKLKWKRGIGHVRFTHEGKRYEVTTGERDPGRAAKVAAQIYAQTISGRRKQRVVSRSALAEIIATWLDDYEASHDRRTSHNVMLVARAQWLPRWSYLYDVTDAQIADYIRDRLREVSRSMLLKELSHLRQFFRWCVAHELVSDAPTISRPHDRAMGKRKTPRIRTPLTKEEAKRVIDALPVESTRARRGPHRHRIRDFFIVLWETGLRPITVMRLVSPTHFKKGDTTLRVPAEIDKGRYERELPLTADAIAALTRSAPTVGPIFGHHKFRRTLEEVGLRVLGRRVTLTDFRHGRITSLVESDAPLPGIQYLAGHKQMSTTARYVHPSARAAAIALGLKAK